ncbi:hypothetical protein ScPMuIL_015341 [Solemya velum]
MNVICTTNDHNPMKRKGCDSRENLLIPLVFAVLLLIKTAMLMFGRDAMRIGQFNNSYMGSNTTIRDIPVKRWSYCSDQSGGDTVILHMVDFYYSVDWESPSGDTTFPVRIRMELNEYFGKGAQVLQIHVYDYVYFQSSLPSDLSIFQVPDGMFCSGRKTTATLHEISQYFSFRAEVSFPAYQVTGVLDEWYDYEAKLVRTDASYMPKHFYSTPDDTSPKREIHDFKTGVSYTLDLFTGKCHITQLEVDGFDTGFLDPNHIVIKSPQQFFNLDDRNVSYLGKREVRGIPADAWSATRHNFPPGQNATSHWEWYFASGMWRIARQSGARYGIPLKMQITFPEANTTAIYQIFDFETEKPEYSAFDVSACYDEGDIRFFRFNMTGNIDTIAPKPKVLKLALQKELEIAMNVSQLRIQGLDILLDKYGVYVLFALLGPPTIEGAENTTSNVSVISSESAAQQLKMYINKSAFNLTVEIELTLGIQTATFSAVPWSVRETVRDKDGNLIDIGGTTTVQTTTAMSTTPNATSHTMTTMRTSTSSTKAQQTTKLLTTVLTTQPVCTCPTCPTWPNIVESTAAGSATVQPTNARSTRVQSTAAGSATVQPTDARSTRVQSTAAATYPAESTRKKSTHVWSTPMRSTKEFQYPGTRVTEPLVQYPQNDSIWKTGTVAGLAVGMAVLGCFIGSFITVIVHESRKKRGPDTLELIDVRKPKL